MAIPSMAQENRGRGHFNPEEYRAKLEEYITQKACLSQTEAKQFFPLLHEMKEKQRALNKKIIDLKRNHPAASTPDSEYDNIINQISDLTIQSAKLESCYRKKMCKVVSARKVYNAMLAEDSFHREMLGRFSPGPGRGGNNDRGGKPQGQR